MYKLTYYVFIALWQIFIYLSYDNKFRQNVLESPIYWPSQNYYFKNRKFVTLFLDYFLTEGKISLKRTVFYSIKNRTGTFLVGEWLGICLPMQGTCVRFLVREDPTCCGASKPMHPNYGSPGTLGSVDYCLLICLILASGAARHLPAHLPDTRQVSRATPACSSAWYSPAIL